MNGSKYSRVFGAVSSTVRVGILQAVKQQSCSAEDLAKMLGVEKTSLNTHINMLVNMGFIDSEKDGRVTIYKFATDGEYANIANFCLAQLTESLVDFNAVQEETVSVPTPATNNNVKEVKSVAAGKHPVAKAK